MSDIIVPVSDVMQMADVVVKSGLFPAFKNRESAAAMMLLCRAKGLDPMTAIERYHIVQGRPVMRADAMLGEFCRMGGKVEWHRRDEQEAKATFSHQSGGSVTVSWTMKMANDAKLTSKDVWRQYPRQMLHARCVSEGVRSVLPGATNGLYTPEEAYNMEPEVPRIAVAAIVEPQEQPVEAKDKTTLIQIMSEFAKAATERGYEITTNGKASRRRMIDLAQTVVGEFDADSVDAWNLALNGLVETGDGDDTSHPQLDEEISDPFAG